MGGGSASAQSVERFAVDSAISINKFVGRGAGDQPDIMIDVTATARLGGGWVAFVRPWFRRASTDPYALSKEIYQAAVQHERPGRIATRIELGYILSPIGIGMMDMRPDTNPVIWPHLSYLIPMPSFDPGTPASMPIASSYPLGGQLTASATRWDARAAVVNAPPNRTFVLNVGSPNPPSRPVVVIGGGVTPRTGLRLGAVYAAGDHASREEVTRGPSEARGLKMVSVEGEFAFGYSKLTGELTKTRVATASGRAKATEWFLQGVHTLTPRLFIGARYEGVNAPPSLFAGPHPTLRTSEATAGFRLTPAFTLRASVGSRKTYFSPLTSHQVGASLVWAQRWW